MIFSFFFNAKTIKKKKKPKLSNYPDDVVQVKKNTQENSANIIIMSPLTLPLSLHTHHFSDFPQR